MITLTRLSLKNFAVVSAVEINLDRGLSVITGETGTGKSLIVGAISLILGERGKTEYVRSGASSASVEGEFRGDFSTLTTRGSPTRSRIFSTNGDSFSLRPGGKRP